MYGAVLSGVLSAIACHIGACHAPGKRQVEEDDIGQHPQGSKVGAPTEAGSCHCTQSGTQVRCEDTEE